MTALPRASTSRRRRVNKPAAAIRSGVLAWGLLAIGLGLACLVLSEALIANWETARPDLALALRPDDAEALSQAAQDLVGPEASPQTLDRAENLASASLRRQAVNAPALRVLAQISLLRRREAEAVSRFSAAERLSRRDLRTEAWLYVERLRRNDLAAAMKSADAILRVSPAASDVLYGTLSALARTPQGQSALAEPLRLSPSWRPRFLSDLARKEADPMVAADLMARLDERGSPPTSQELEPVLARLVGARRYLDAYLVWHGFAPADAAAQGSVRDSGFNGLDAPPPFRWTIAQDSGASVETAAAPSLEHAGRGLHVRYDGVSRARNIANQLLVLGPGSYRLTGRVYVATPLQAARMVWSVSCAENGGVIARMGDGPLDVGWTDLSAAFEVPPQGCEGQWLRLGAVEGERGEDIEVWYDDLTVRRWPPSA